MIVAVGSAKGSPGASTLALLLGLAWPGERLVAELDPRGADLPYRVASATGGPLAASPTVTTLAVDTRPGAPQRSLGAYVQPAACGVPLLVGETAPARLGRIVSQLPLITDVLAVWPGTVLADLGSLQLTSPVVPVARRAAVTVIVTRTDTASLGHLRDRVGELAADLGGPHRLRSPVAVVCRSSRRDASAAQTRVERLLTSAGSPATVLGTVPDDHGTVAAVCAGLVTRRMARSGLLTVVSEIALRLRGTWPELIDPGPSAGTVELPDGAVAARTPQ